jgi:hypothetical protein
MRFVRGGGRVIRNVRNIRRKGEVRAWECNVTWRMECASIRGKEFEICMILGLDEEDNRFEEKRQQC